MKTNKARKTIFTSISVLALVLMTVVFGISFHAQTIVIGDMNNDSVVNEDDAAYLLRHVLLPSTYPIDQSGDLNGDGKVNVDDALYLSKHITGPDEYPLTCHHSFGEWTQTKAPTCTEKGEEKRTCNNCGQVETRDFAALGHNAVSHDAKAPTCTEKGWDAYVTCSRCDYTTYVKRPALGHNKVSHTAKAPTCTEIGWYAYVTCTRCDYTTYMERSALGHEYISGVCKNCGKNEYSVGLSYTLSSDGTSYYVSGIGTCKDKDVVIPSKYNGKPVISIGYCAFKDCSSLMSIEIPDSVTRIGSQAFLGCSSLTSIEIPNGVTSIGDRAFVNCHKLVEVYNLSSLNITVGSAENGYVGYYALVVHTSADEPANVFTDKNGYIFFENGDTCYLLGYKGTDTSLTLPKNCNGKNYGIYWDAFGGCWKLTSIKIPDSVTSIGAWAFLGCSSLKSINIPDGVTSIGTQAFYRCSSLKSINIPDGITSIGFWVFAYCEYLTSVEIPDSVTSIGDRAFEGCKRLTSVKIGNGVTSIGYDTFYGCKSLTSITIPDSVTSIREKAFCGCTSLASVKIGNGVTSIGYDTFYNTAYYNNEYNWVDGVLHIGNYLIKAKSDTLPADYTIKAGTKCIADAAFESCTSLKSIEILDSVTSIGDRAFSYCSSLTSITVDARNTVYHSAGNCVIRTSSKTLVVGCKNSIIPNDGSVTSIGYRAFEYCSSLTSIKIPDSVTSIDDEAFWYCSSLTSINFNGTKAQWDAINKGSNWDYHTGSYTIYCTDGTISK